MSNRFDGWGGRFIAPITARMNRAAVREAVDRLAPATDAHILVLGFGPGVGIEYLSRQLPQCRIFGIDPSSAMMAASARRNWKAIASGQVRLEQCTADAIPVDEACFDGALAVNTLQLCEPVEDTVRELARVLRPGGRFVSITHAWAAEHHAGTTQKWEGAMVSAFSASHFETIVAARANAENGKAVLLMATRKSV